MSLAIFIVGVLVFLITVYGTVMVGGLFLTGRQLDAQPELVPDQPAVTGNEGAADQARRLVSVDY